MEEDMPTADVELVVAGQSADTTDQQAMALLALANKITAEQPVRAATDRQLEAIAAQIRFLVSMLTSGRLIIAVQEGLTRNLPWDGTRFYAAFETAALAQLLKELSESGMHLRPGPERVPCDTPGKTAWHVKAANFFEIDDDYIPVKLIGQGAFGVVCSAITPKFETKVAIKKIGNAFEKLTNARRTLREIKLLRHLKHENVILLKDIMRLPPRDHFTDVYLIYDLMDTDLDQIIRSPQPLNNEHLKFLIYQILRGLKYIHSANVLHRDLKPCNLLLNASCELKICDFGLARTSTERDFMTEYVVTRWYRAPELLLSCDTYGPAIDVWSVGCILAELLGRQPLFPGKDCINQLELIIQGLGPSTTVDLDFISSQRAKELIRTHRFNHAQLIDFNTRFQCADPQAIDLLRCMLRFDPRQRITVMAALEHKWLAEHHDLSREPLSSSKFEFDFEEDHLTEEGLRHLVYEEIRNYHQ